MAKIILIQALPASPLNSRENLARALTLLQGCQGQEADLICFPEYFPFSGEEELAAARPDIVGGIVGFHGDREFVQAIYFTSEDAAREGEKSMQDDGGAAEWEAMLDGPLTFTDLHDIRLD